MKKFTFKKPKKGGFTLVEMLMAIAVFILVLGSASGLFVWTIQKQTRALLTQELLSQTSYLIEYMSRYIRMAKKDLTGTCLTTAGAKNNYETNEARDRIRFLNYRDICQEFFLEGNQIKERKSTDKSAANFGAPLPLTSPRLQVVSFKLGPPDSWDQEDTDQPRVTISLNIKTRELQPTPPEIKIQTTISQRELDVKY